MIRQGMEDVRWGMCVMGDGICVRLGMGDVWDGGWEICEMGDGKCEMGNGRSVRALLLLLSWASGTLLVHQCWGLLALVLAFAGVGLASAGVVSAVIGIGRSCGWWELWVLVLVSSWFIIHPPLVICHPFIVHLQFTIHLPFVVHPWFIICPHSSFVVVVGLDGATWWGSRGCQGGSQRWCGAQTMYVGGRPGVGNIDGREPKNDSQ